MNAVNKRYNNRMYYGDVAEVALAAGLHIEDLWWPIAKFDDPFDRSNAVYTTDGLVLRYLCQHFPITTVNKALGR